MQPLVSIIIPTFNRAHLIEETLDSVLAQSYTHWECIVIDDGSTDNTTQILEKYQSLDLRFIYKVRPKNRNKGASACRNIGLEMAKGEFIQFLDSDDLISANKLKEQVKLLIKDKDYDIATCMWGRFSDKIGDGILYNELKVYNHYDDVLDFLNDLAIAKGYLPLHTYLIKLKLITKAGFFNESLTLNDDGEFMIRVLLNSRKIVFASKAMAYYRWTNQTNLSAFNELDKVNNCILSWILIEASLKIQFKSNSIPYIINSKNALYKNVKKSFPELLAIHKHFFKEQLKRDIWLFKLKRGITKKIKNIIKDNQNNID